MKKNRYLILVLIATISFFLSLSFGSVDISIKEILKNEAYKDIVFYMRAPRVIAAFLIGGSLAISGATIQSLFQNPMADPSILGISSGASLGAILAITFGFSTTFSLGIPFLAICFAFISSILVYKMASIKGKNSILTLILSGIAINLFLGAVNSFILLNISESQIREYIFWSMGNLSGKEWNYVIILAIPMSIFSIFLVKKYKELNILLLGDENGSSLGLDVIKFRRKILFVTSILTALSVCIGGNIGFVGLVIPHIVRFLIGSNNRDVLPMSFLLGGIFLMNTDLVSRVVLAPKEVSIGVITALIGAPYFIYLLLRYKKESF